MSLYRILYTSRPFGYDEATLNGILMDARRANARDGVTGALICRDDIYMQWLEGPEAAVKAALDRIRGDDRHVEVRPRLEGPAPARVFEAWSMLHDPAVTWLWSAKEIAGGAVDDAAPGELEAIFLDVRRRAAANDAG